MEFKRSNSSRGPLTSGRGAKSQKPSSGNTTPLRSTRPLKKNSARCPSPTLGCAAASSNGSPALPLPPRKASLASARHQMLGAPDDTNPPLQSTSATPPKSARKANTFERSASGTGSRGAFKRSNTAAGMRRAEALKHNNRVNVYVRVRAFREDESSGSKGQLAVNMNDGAVEVTVPKKGRFTFGFDGCFWSNDRTCPSGKASASQEDVFDEIGRPLVENALAGYNAAVMAYGQTGSGKTFTSFGPPGSIGTSQEGLVPRVCNMIFSRAATSAQKGVTYTVSASMLEVYLEDVFDLLNHRKELSVRNDFTSNTFSVVGQKTVSVKSYKDVLAVLNKAEPLRTFAATNIHDHSSRAHTLFMLEVQTHFDAPELAPRCARILLADLAGCERIKLAGTEEGLAFEQARNINLSLLALGSCIEAVATRGRNNSRPIPEFRNSTLTKLLKDYIGGNSISTMMVTISPSEHDANLSVQTLRFADRAKQITTHARVNTVDPEQAKQDGCDMSDRWRDEYLRKKEALYAEYQLKGTIEKLLARIADLEEKLRSCSEDELALHLTTEIEELQKALTEADYQMGLQRQILYGEFLMLEDELREMNTKMQEMKEEHEEAIEGLLGEEAGRYEDMKRGYETRLRAQQDKSDAAQTASEDEIAALRQLVSELQERLAAKEAECADLSHRLCALQEKYDADMRAAEGARGELEEQLAAARAENAKLEDAGSELRQQIEERHEQLATVEARLQESETQASELTKRLATTTHTAAERETEQILEIQVLQGTVERLNAGVSSTEGVLQETAAKLEETEGKLQQAECTIEETQSKLVETEGKLEQAECAIEETQSKLVETEGKLEQAECTIEETQSMLVETEGKLEQAECTIEETQSKLDDTDARLQETAAKLEETEETLSSKITSLAKELAGAQTLGDEQYAYIEHLMVYMRTTYDVTLGGLTELQLTALGDLMNQARDVVHRVTCAAKDEVDRMKEMYDCVDGNYKETAARFDLLRRVLGKIDEDLKEANVEIDVRDSRQKTDSLQRTPRRLTDVSNRDNSKERKSAVL